MAFGSFEFIYNPPPTVDNQVPVTTGTNTGVLGNATVDQIKAASNSSALLAQLSELQEANAFIQQAIINACNGTLVLLDPNTDPDVAVAAQQVYAQVPSGVTVAMYSNLINAQITSQLLASSVSGSTSQVNPAQLGYLSTLVSNVDNSLLNDVTMTSQLPLLLRSLATDQAMFQALASNLASYPVQSATNTTITANNTLDISPELSSYLNSTLDQFATNYGAIYTLTTALSTVATDLNVANSLVGQTTAELVQMAALISAAKGLIYKDSLKDLVKDIGNFVYARLVLDASAVVFEADKVTQMALMPFKQITGEVAQLQSQVSALTRLIGVMPNGHPLAGLLKANSACSNSGVQYNSALYNQCSAQTGTNALTQGVIDAVSGINWLQTTVNKKLTQGLDQFKKVLGRRLANQNLHCNLLSSLSAMEALYNAAAQLINKSTGTTSLPTITGITIPTTPPISTASPTVQSLLKL